jgi:hypothetical protein
MPRSSVKTFYTLALSICIVISTSISLLFARDQKEDIDSRGIETFFSKFFGKILAKLRVFAQERR